MAELLARPHTPRASSPPPAFSSEPVELSRYTAVSTDTPPPSRSRERVASEGSDQFVGEEEQLRPDLLSRTSSVRSIGTVRTFQTAPPSPLAR